MPHYSLYSPSRYRAHLSSARKVQIAMLDSSSVINPTRKSQVIATDRNGVHLETVYITKYDFKEREKVFNKFLANHEDCYVFTHW